MFQFTSIAIPAGVTVHLRGSNAARLLCTGGVSIAGTLEGDADPSLRGGPGGYDGSASSYWLPPLPGGGPALNRTGIGGDGLPAAHATSGTYHSFAGPAQSYGAALPFDLQGGSGGSGAQTPQLSITGTPSTGGGGAIALLADGPIQIAGRVSARSSDIVVQPYGSIWPGGPGSGGAILIRSLQCVTVTGTLDATGGIVFFYNTTGGDGWIRVDAYSASCSAPLLAGATVHPAPLATALPYLASLGQARIGQTYRVRCASVPGDVLGWYVSPGTASLALPPFGTLELDPNAGIFFLGQYSVPTTGVDPLAVADIAIPSSASLLGITLHSQMFNAFNAVTGQARLSNRLTTTISN